MSDSAAGSEYNGDDFYCDVAIPHVAALQVEHND
ncbi:MAG: HIT family hydrolase, partial [Nocardioidaceae bacterium]|nr:HIT family hydrolase [Nocardioidaceae bacterium]